VARQRQISRFYIGADRSGFMGLGDHILSALFSISSVEAGGDRRHSSAREMAAGKMPDKALEAQ